VNQLAFIQSCPLYIHGRYPPRVLLSNNIIIIIYTLGMPAIILVNICTFLGNVNGTHGIASGIQVVLDMSCHLPFKTTLQFYDTCLRWSGCRLAIDGRSHRPMWQPWNQVDFGKAGAGSLQKHFPQCLWWWTQGKRLNDPQTNFVSLPIWMFDLSTCLVL